MNGWSAIEQARRGDRAARVPFHLGTERVGSVARRDLPVLAEIATAAMAHGSGAATALRPAPAAATGAWTVRADAVVLAGAAPDAALAAVNAALRERGLIRAWRDEPYAVRGADGVRVLARIERAASRFWGTCTQGAHATGWVAGADGRPAALWVAQRAFDKATDPGRHDNLIGGGVPHGQTPWQTLLREGWEEAGLPAALLRRARPGRVAVIERDVPEGWQWEHLHAFDLELPAGTTPANQDGEVERFELLPVAQALALAADGAMTVDASVVTLDFALRHRLLGPHRARRLAVRAAGLWQLGGPGRAEAAGRPRPL